MKYFHPQKGVLVPKGKKYKPLLNKSVDMFEDTDGKLHELDGTEIDYKEVEEMMQEAEMADMEDQEMTRTEIKDMEDEIDEEDEKEEENKQKDEMMMKHHQDMLDEIEDASEVIVEAIKAIPAPVENFSDQEKWKNEILEALKIEIPEVDLAPVIKAIESIKIPEVKIPESKDYTQILEAIKKALPKDTDMSGVIEAISKIPQPKEVPFEFKDGRLKVEVDRVALGANGQGGIQSDLVHTNVHTGVNELRVYSEGHVCTQNSTSTPLGINGVFTGDWQDTLDYSEIIVSVGTDKASVTNGLQILWSADAVTVNGDDTYTIAANSDKTFSFPCQRRYVKVIYTNDGVAQTRFNLSTLLKRFASKGSSHRLLDNLNQEDDAIVTKSQIVGFSTAGGGSLVNVKANPSGALTVDVGASVLPTGAATESTLQAVLAAQGGSVYNFIQSDEDATYKYYGYASSTGWRFKRKTLATGVWQVAEGLGDYDTNWALRASKTYLYV